MSSAPFDRKEGWEILAVLKYRVVEGLYRLIGRLVLRREEYRVTCSCGHVQNHVYVPSYRGASILESGYWARFRPECPGCSGGGRKITAFRTKSELGEALYRLPGYSEHARKSFLLQERQSH